MKKSGKNKNKVEYHLDTDGCFVIENYNQSKPFSNFFPGVAGLWGIPMWVFFVNRGQCIASFGIESKDKAMLEFQPANKAYRLTSLQGFRTFIKVKSGSKAFFWEPFRDHPSSKSQQKMYMTSHDLTIEETNAALGLVARVNYFTMPQEDFPALVRRVTIENISRKKYAIELIDGLPVITSFGIKDWLAKNLSRTVEAWIKVRNLKNKAPFFHLDVEVSDTPDVVHITEGNFYFSFTASASGQKQKLSDTIVDASCVFAGTTDFLSPQRFLESKHYQVPSVQQTSNRTPCAMSFTKFALSPKRRREMISLTGYAKSEAHLQKIVKQTLVKDFIDKKAKRNEDTILSVKRAAFTNSSSPEFNQYSSQTFLDNVLRGGLPVSLRTRDGGYVTFNVFSRKHGDLERDYNHFTLSPTPFSQGNGNYRDVNQNRRNDVWFNKNVRDNNIVNFLSLLQADGYNPLVVKGVSFAVADPSKIDAVMESCIKKGDTHLIRHSLLGGFQPGELLNLVAHNNIPLKVPPKEFLASVLGICHKQELADHGEGFWTDHWTYNLDLIESYLAIYPEDLRALLLERKDFSFYLNDHYVLPRQERYVLTDKGVRQYHAVKSGAKEIHASAAGHKLRTQNGQGEIYFTTLLAKLLCLITNKAATWDPSGIGIEMEAGKPGWYDSLNGLPGLLGSSICETLELKRYCVFIINQIEQMHLRSDDVIKVFEELGIFMDALEELLLTEKDPVSYWHKANDVKETYRSRVRKGIEGEEQAIPMDRVRNFLTLIIARADGAIKKAGDKKGLFPTYFFYEVTRHKKLTGRHVYPVEFKKHVLPLFLEGFVHALRVETDQDKARKLYQVLRKSPLFDKKLKMYKVNAELSGQSEEIGRTRIFPRGWLENESIWLHMEYKYLLELLRVRLFKEFYETFEDTLIPFLDGERYGRSPLENSSFIVSSAHEDPSLHGQGFVARLSGSTAEFMHIWLLMNAGKTPFRIDNNGQLYCVLKPALAGWLFTKKAQTIEYLNKKRRKETISFPKNTYAFNFLGLTLVVYHNSKRRNTYGKSKCRIKKIVLTYPHNPRPSEITGEIIPAVYAKDIRNNKVDRIDVYFEA